AHEGFGPGAPDGVSHDEDVDGHADQGASHDHEDIDGHGHADQGEEGFEASEASNVTRRKDHSNEVRQNVYAMILRRTASNRLCHGVIKQVHQEIGISLRTVQRIWQRGQEGGVHGLNSRKSKNCGRKSIDIDYDSIKQIPLAKRTTYKDAAHELRVSTTTVWRR
ncbi:hypothetical protein BRADI_4g14721v3, partial [Brachypodium distachyon]